MKYLKNSFLILFTIALLHSCGTIQSYKIGELFEIELDKEGVGGYEWNYIAIPEVVTVDSSVVTIPVENKLAINKKRFKLKGIKKGIYQIEFHHLRSFEKFDTIPKEHIKIFKIKIKK